MTRQIKILLPVFALLLVFGACRKDILKDSTTIITPDPSITVETGVRGVVSDETGNPIEGATVTLGTNTTTTNEIGYFFLEGLASQAQGFIKVEKAGYFPSFGSFYPRVGDVSRVNVSLRMKNLTATINTSNGGEVSLPGGSRVTFQSNSFVDEAGNPYNGQVSVYMSYLDPTEEITEELVPATWGGFNEEGERNMLISYGMIQVLLEGSGGQKLQINKPASVIVAVPAELQGSAPASIPLWSLDENTGFWIEEGVAELDGNVYKGSVSHFSLWNCDVGVPIVDITGRLRISGESPYVYIRVTRLNGEGSCTTVPNESGYFGGAVPANEDLLLEVVNLCGEVIYSQNFGPLTDDFDFGDISVDAGVEWIEVSGTLLNCDMDPVTNGIVRVNTSGISEILEADPVTGAFSGVIANCSSTDVTVTGYDLDELFTSEDQTLPAAPTVDFGDIDVCDGQIQSGVLIEFEDQTTYFIPDATVTVSNDSIIYYEVLATDDQGGGDKVVYTFTILNWSTPMDPFWALAYNLTNFGSPITYGIEAQGGDIVQLMDGSQPGELVIFELNNVVVDEQPAGTLHQNCKVTITAIVQ